MDKQDEQTILEQRYKELEQKTFEECFDDAAIISEQKEEIEKLKQKIQCQEIPKGESTSISSENEVIYENAFIRQADFWEIWFQGNKLGPIKKLDGMIYIANLLSKPDQMIHVTNLCDSVNPQKKDQAMMGEDDMRDSLKKGNMSISNMEDDVLSKEAKKELKKEIKELKETIADNDLPKSEKWEAQKKYDDLVKALSQYGRGALTGKKKVNEAVKKDMDRVLKAINRAYKKIYKQSPELSDYLKLSIKTGVHYIFSHSGTPWHVSL